MQHSQHRLFYFFSYKKLVVYISTKLIYLSLQFSSITIILFISHFFSQFLSTVPSSFTPKYVLIDLVMLLIVESTEFIRLSTVFPVLDLIATLFSVLPLLSTFLISRFFLFIFHLLISSFIFFLDFFFILLINRFVLFWPCPLSCLSMDLSSF